MSEQAKADPAAILDDLQYLVNECGERVAGSPAEKKALRFLVRRYKEMGLDNPRIEQFEFAHSRIGDFGGEAKVGGRTIPLQTRPCEYAASTPKGGVEGELLFMDSSKRSDYGGEHLKGKIGLFLGAPMPKREYLDAMQNSGLAAAIIVDHRGTSRWPMSLGFPEMWADRINMPIFSLSYEQAWQLATEKRQRPVRVKLWCQTRRIRGKSGNALAELPGSDPALREELIYVSGHVDSVRGSVGANDDGSGTAFTLAVADALRRAPLRRTVRFAGYGVEERLSVGSFRHFQNRDQNGMANAVFGYNADSCGAVMGINKLTFTGPKALGNALEKVCCDTGYVADVVDGVNPFSDQFALNMLDVPTVWIYRMTNTSGNWFFHSEHDNLDACDERMVAQSVDFAVAFLREIDSKDKLPFKVSLPSKTWKEVCEQVKLYHGIELER